MKLELFINFELKLSFFKPRSYAIHNVLPFEVTHAVCNTLLIA